MAQAHWTNAKVAAEPERQLAVLAAAQACVSPPVDIEALVRERADIEWDSIPRDCDALLLDLGGRYRLIMSRERHVSPNRTRFTLAHELGHLVIPWHGGSFFCNTAMDAHFADAIRGTMEVEANRFASEMLVPTQWLAQRIGQLGELAESIAVAANDAQVSLEVALFAAGRACTASVALAILDGHQRVDAMVFGKANDFRGIRKGHLFPQASLTKAGARIERYPVGSREIACVSFPPRDVPAAFAATESREIRDAILAALPIEDGEREHLTHVIGGLAGAHRAKPGADRAGYFSALKIVFVNRPDLSLFVGHALFDAFLNARAAELLLPSQRKRRRGRPERVPRGRTSPPK